LNYNAFKARQSTPLAFTEVWCDTNSNKSGGKGVVENESATAQHFLLLLALHNMFKAKLLKN